MRKLQHAAIIAALLLFQHLVGLSISGDQIFTGSGRVSGKLSPRAPLIPSLYPHGDWMSSPSFTLWFPLTPWILWNQSMPEKGSQLDFQSTVEISLCLSP